MLCVILAGFLICEILLNLTPPISRDALIHHLAIPKLWLKHGIFHEIPWADFSYYPMNIDLLYLLCLYFKSDVIPKSIHLTFAFGTGLLVYQYLRNRLNKNWGLLGFLIFFSTPVVILLSTTAYVDLGMTFFTTASVLAFVRWRDENYKDAKWLVLSAVSMGLAAGSKYNALIAWFFLNLMLIFYYVRDTRREIPALKYGVVFFLIALTVVSPWYIRNYMLTANPLYPLFDGFFKALHHINNGDGGLAGVATAKVSGIFQRRGVMFGESFWETVLIPIRMFFQGKDGSVQYFDGVLNPILIIMLPFAFLNRVSRSSGCKAIQHGDTGFPKGPGGELTSMLSPVKRDKLFFLLFCVFFLCMAYFLTVIRIRYILPVVPFLTILSVCGIKNITEWLLGRSADSIRYVGLIGIFLFIIISIACNFLYLNNYFHTVRPLEYICHRETRDDFLTRHLGSYPSMKYINENLTGDSMIFLMFLGRRGYYLDRPYYCEPSFGIKTLRGMVKASGDGQALRTYLQSLNCTHVLVRMDLFHKYLHDNYPEKTIIHFLSLVRGYWRPAHVSNGYAVYALSF
jgi:hypothetical protein